VAADASGRTDRHVLTGRARRRRHGIATAGTTGLGAVDPIAMRRPRKAPVPPTSTRRTAATTGSPRPTPRRNDPSRPRRSPTRSSSIRTSTGFSPMGAAPSCSGIPRSDGSTNTTRRTPTLVLGAPPRRDQLSVLASGRGGRRALGDDGDVPAVRGGAFAQGSSPVIGGDRRGTRGPVPCRPAPELTSSRAPGEPTASAASVRSRDLRSGRCRWVASRLDPAAEIARGSWWRPA
jgi:hypothetical protein